jgi:hypothetical protein
VATWGQRGHLDETLRGWVGREQVASLAWLNRADIPRAGGRATRGAKDGLRPPAGCSLSVRTDGEGTGPSPPWGGLLHLAAFQKRPEDSATHPRDVLHIEWREHRATARQLLCGRRWHQPTYRLRQVLPAGPRQ